MWSKPASGDDMRVVKGMSNEPARSGLQSGLGGRVISAAPRKIDLMAEVSLQTGVTSLRSYYTNRDKTHDTAEPTMLEPAVKVKVQRGTAHQHASSDLRTEHLSVIDLIKSD